MYIEGRAIVWARESASFADVAKQEELIAVFESSVCIVRGCIGSGPALTNTVDVLLSGEFRAGRDASVFIEVEDTCLEVSLTSPAGVLEMAVCHATDAASVFTGKNGIE